MDRQFGFSRTKHINLYLSILISVCVWSCIRLKHCMFQYQIFTLLKAYEQLFLVFHYWNKLPFLSLEGLISFCSLSSSSGVLPADCHSSPQIYHYLSEFLSCHHIRPFIIFSLGLPQPLFLFIFSSVLMGSSLPLFNVCPENLDCHFKKNGFRFLSPFASLEHSLLVISIVHDSHNILLRNHVFVAFNDL